MDHRPISPLVERVARSIALHHGSKILYYDPDNTAVTVAMRRGFAPWAHGADEYAQKRWPEYQQAAEMAIQIVRGADAEGPKP